MRNIDQSCWGTLNRTILMILSAPEPTELFVCVENGRAMVGHKSKHLSPSGVKYNKLIRLHRRLHK